MFTLSKTTLPKFLEAFKWNTLYSVMQFDGNSFCGDVVLDSFNKSSRDEDIILD